MKRSIRAIAELQARDIDRAVNRSSVLSARLWRAASTVANQRREIGVNGDKRVPLFAPELIQPAIDELTDLMAYSYLLRFKMSTRRRKINKQAKLELASPVHVAAGQIAHRINLDLGNVRKRFQPIASKAINTSVKSIRSTMNTALAEATELQLTTRDATAFVLGAVRKLGVEPRGSQYIETLVRTHSAIAYGAAHRQNFQGDVDLWGFQYVTVGDNRVRPEHERLDGMRRKAADEIWQRVWPPNGWNCRCQVVAIYDDEVSQTRIPSDIQIDEEFETDFQDLLAP